MRIVGGSLRGRRFDPPKNFGARPTTDFAKEGLFDVLSNYFDFEELTVLDLFSGTGSISLEFASRGARHIDAVEKIYAHQKFIKDSALRLGVTSISVIRQDVFSFISRSTCRYGLIFADPPYDMEDINTLPELILSKDLLDEDGWLVVEHSDRYSFSGLKQLIDHRRYGSVNFSFFRKNI